MKIYLSLIIVAFSAMAFSQDQVKWTGTFNTESNEIVLHADIEEGWHLYSQHLGNDLGPIPTEFTFTKNRAITFSDTTEEPTPLESYDENFGGNLSYFEESVDFTQKIKVKESTAVICTVLYMVCNAEMCMPPTEEKIEIQINK